MHRRRKRTYTYFVDKSEKYSTKTILRKGKLVSGIGLDTFQYYNLMESKWKQAVRRRNVVLIPISIEEIAKMYRPIIEWPNLIPKNYGT